MSDSRLRYFNAVTENKKKAMELKNAEIKIDCLQKQMLTRYWKDKIEMFDDMIRLNVKTPRCGDYEATETAEHVNLGPMQVDVKLLSNKPVSLQRGNKKWNGGRVEPVISIEGSEAVCYPSKEAKNGRKVGLSLRMLKMMEQCKALSRNIDKAQSQKERISDADSLLLPRRRPLTAPRSTHHGSTMLRKRKTSIGVRTASMSKPLETEHAPNQDVLPLQLTSPRTGADIWKLPNRPDAVCRRTKSAPKIRFK